MTKYDASLGARLKSARCSRGWKQDYLAARLGVSQATIAKWESGARFPSVAMQKRLKDLLWKGGRVDPLAAQVAADFGYSCICRAEDSSYLLLSPGLRGVNPKARLGEPAIEMCCQKTAEVIEHCWREFGRQLDGLLGVHYLWEVQGVALSSNWQVFQGNSESRVLVRDSALLLPQGSDPGLRLITVDDVCDYALGD